nr:hypothetical protein DWF04_18385 [Cereibacter sphaeroides f. sp. denitrificans]
MGVSVMDAHSMGQAAEGPQAEQFATYSAMKGVPRWLLWKEVPNPDPQKKPRKVPHYVNGSTRDKTDTPEDWAQLATYDAAKAALAQAGVGWGLAFALGSDGAGGHWQGIDLDDITANRLADLANTVAGYVEMSPSSQGAHAIGYGRHFATLGSNQTGIEAYAAGRFFTVTERPIRDSGLVCLAGYVEQHLAPRHAVGRAIAATSGAPVEVVQIDAKTVATLRSALTYLRADDRQLWVAVGHALKELGEIGRGLWLDWSQTSAQYRPDIDPKKWDDLSCDRTGWQSVLKKAQDAGWVNPASSAAQLPAVPTETPAQRVERMKVDWSSDDEDVEVPDIVEGLVADEEVTLLGGHGGIGKSYLALQMAFAVALGQPILGCVTRQSRVLYYSAEDDRKRLTRRSRKIADRFGYDRETVDRNLLVLDASDVDPLFGETYQDVGSGEKPFMVKMLGATDYFANLQQMVQAFDPQLVVIDGASDTFDGDEIVRKHVRAFIKVLRCLHPSRKIGVLLMVHIDRASARGNSSADDGYAGSAQWHNSCRRRLWLQAEMERDPDTRKMEKTGVYLLRVMKNQDGKPLDDMVLTNSPDGIWQQSASFGGQFAPGPRAITPPPNHGPVIAQLIQEHYERGQYITASTAPNAPNGPYAVLQHDPLFPPELKRAKRAASETVAVVQRLQREGVLEVEAYKNDQRKNAVRWRVVKPLGELVQDEQEGAAEVEDA